MFAQEGYVCPGCDSKLTRMFLITARREGAPKEKGVAETKTDVLERRKLSTPRQYLPLGDHR